MPETEIKLAPGLDLRVSAVEGVDACGRKILYMDFCEGIVDAKLEAPAGNNIETHKSGPGEYCPICGRPLAVVFDDHFLAERDEYAGQSFLPDVPPEIAPIACDTADPESSPGDRNA